MIAALRLCTTHGTNPYRNLAREELLLRGVRAGECILYLWQNHRTVVIGRNQNPWRECHMEALAQDGGFLARRLSGGGAVFHDAGNLNFTFLVCEADYSVARQLSVILRALELLGVPAQATGRNDVSVEGRKVSGNAFYKAGGQCCHHGTLLVAADGARMGRYLNVSAEKLRGKGVASVRARVANLTEFRPQLTVETLRAALVQAFAQVYGGVVQPMEKGRCDGAALEQLTRKYASQSWRLGRTCPFSWQAERRFAWGNAQICLQVRNGHVAQAAVYSDAMEQAWIAALPAALEGQQLLPQTLAQAVRSVCAASVCAQEQVCEMARDIVALLGTL